MHTLCSLSLFYYKVHFSIITVVLLFLFIKKVIAYMINTNLFIYLSQSNWYFLISSDGVEPFMKNFSSKLEFKKMGTYLLLW